MRFRFALIALSLFVACAVPDAERRTLDPATADSGFNLAHLDFLGEDVVRGADTLRFVHIYAEAPDFRFVGDDDEGIACVDDAARAAVVYLRHFELSGDLASRDKAIRLLRFVRYMQAPTGLFYNFVTDEQLRVNTEHQNSVADQVSWWTARAVWALGTGARVLAETAPTEAAASEAAIRLVEPHLDYLLARYGETAVQGGFTFPRWLLYETASDATSELLLGLVSLERAKPTAAGRDRIRKFSEGLAMARFGNLSTFPYGGHASWVGGWHGWGNSQTQALAEATRYGLIDSTMLASAEAEATSLYARLLVEGWLHEMTYATGDSRAFEQIAYDVRPAAVGLIRLFEATGDDRYAAMAGLAGSWFYGNNAAQAVMSDPETGRGYDGILDSTRTNPNAGAESTIESQLTLLEVGRVPEAARWLRARAEPVRSVVVGGARLRIRPYLLPAPQPTRAVVVVDLSADTSSVLTDEPAARFLERATPTP